MTGYDLQYTFTARPFVLAILIAVGVSQLAAFIPARRAARINLIEALKHE
jgi:ABC-type lipoprotein release transport system permease subunit